MRTFATRQRTAVALAVLSVLLAVIAEHHPDVNQGCGNLGQAGPWQFDTIAMLVAAGLAFTSAALAARMSSRHEFAALTAVALLAGLLTLVMALFIGNPCMLY